jgi:hypothetical protein
MTEVIEVRTPAASTVEVTGGSAAIEVPTNSGPVAFTHVQDIPSTVWQITHGLGYDPAGIAVVTADGYLADGFGIQYMTAGKSLRLSFDIALSGVAYCS